MTVRNRVLVVEDNDVVAGLLARILARVGLTALRAKSGSDCERIFAGQRAEIALLMLDCRLPDADGVALGLRLRESAPEVPVLLMSGREPAAVRALVEAGEVHFLAKPFLPVQVEARIAALLGAMA